MFEAAVQKIVEKQIESGTMEEADRAVYLYGYQMLIEFCINILTSILIAVIFQAYEIVIIFTIAFLMIRGYVGGYHARTSLGCFCWSAAILLASVITVKGVSSMESVMWLFMMEVVMMPCVFKGSPMPDVNKPITENERVHFNKKVKQIYVIQLLIEVFLLFFGLETSAFSILAVHVVLFIMILYDVLRRRHV